MEPQQFSWLERLRLHNDLDLPPRWSALARVVFWAALAVLALIDGKGKLFALCAAIALLYTWFALRHRPVPKGGSAFLDGMARRAAEKTPPPKS